MQTSSDQKVQVGDTVTYFIKEGGGQSAPVYEVTDHSVIVKTGTGRKISLSHDKAYLVNDGRMNALRIIEQEDVGEARKLRSDFLKLWDARIERYKAQFADEDDKDSVPRGRPPVMVDDSLVSQIISIVKDKKVSTRGEIVKILGTTFNQTTWKKGIDAALRSGEIESHGVRRGTKYTVPGFKIEKAVVTEAAEVSEAAEAVYNKMADYKGTSLDQLGWSRTKIMDILSIDNTTYQAAMKSLIESGKIVKTGAKRGTKYHLS